MSLCKRDIQNFIVCAVATFKTLLNIVCAIATFKLYCLCSRDIQNFIVCAIATFKTLLFVQSSHSKLFSLCVPSGAPYNGVYRLTKNKILLLWLRHIVFLYLILLLSFRITLPAGAFALISRLIFSTIFCTKW